MYHDRDYYRPAGFGGFNLFPPVIKNLLIINIAIFLITELVLRNSIEAQNIIYYYFALLPFGYGFNIWQLVTYQFLHGGFAHLFFNMFSLWMFGIEIENIWGSKKFLIYYLLCGIGGGLLQVLSNPGAPTVGASGAIFGVMIAFAMMFPDRYILFYFFIPIKVKYFILFLVVIEFMSVGSMSFVAHLAHLGGALTGFTYMMLDSKIRVNFGLRNIIDSFKRSSTFNKKPSSQFRKKPFSGKSGDIEEAEFYELGNKKKDSMEITQEEIDRILDKISQSGYQNLTEREKKILFEASKRS